MISRLARRRQCRLSESLGASRAVCGERRSCDTWDLIGEGITVRQCRIPDAGAVLELWAQARSEHASTADHLDDVERLIASSAAALLVAERGGEIVGALIAGWDGWRGNMYRLVVREGDRREGIGIALTRAGEEYLRGCGARRITALVAFEDDAAGAFWESAGYPQDRDIGRRVRNL
jgi:ribosomal protein S18 acetylase RimI-like enzyme